MNLDLSVSSWKLIIKSMEHYLDHTACTENASELTPEEWNQLEQLVEGIKFKLGK